MIEMLFESIVDHWTSSTSRRKTRAIKARLPDARSQFESRDVLHSRASGIDGQSLRLNDHHRYLAKASLEVIDHAKKMAAYSQTTEQAQAGK